MRNTDTVLAKLTPREAILNRNAAELLGRDTIKRLNAHGNMLAKRGVDLASDPAPYPAGQNLAGYQMGTTDVEHEDQGESMMRQGVRFTPQDLDAMQKARQAQDEANRRQAMNEKPVFQFQLGTSDVKDLLRDTENSFYGGGHAPVPSPTPTSTPPRKYQYGTSNVQDPFGQRRNAASRTYTDPFNTAMGVGISYPNDPYQLPGTDPGNTGGSRYIGRGGIDMGPLYDQQGNVNPLPKGAVGSQSAAFNRSLNGSQPQQSSIPTPGRPMTHVEMAVDTAKRNLTAVGASGGLPVQQWMNTDKSEMGNNADVMHQAALQSVSEFAASGGQKMIPMRIPASALGDENSPVVYANGGSGYYNSQRTQYTQPGVNAPVNAFSDPSVGALDTASRTTNQLGQQVIGLPSGGVAITGRANNVPAPPPINNGPWADMKTGQQWVGYGSAYQY